MGSIQFPEIVVIMIIALLLFGPKKLPEIGRTLGGAMRELKKAARDFTESVEQLDIRDDLNQEKESIKQIVSCDILDHEDESVKQPDECYITNHETEPSEQLVAHNGINPEKEKE